MPLHEQQSSVAMKHKLLKIYNTVASKSDVNKNDINCVDNKLQDKFCSYVCYYL